METVTRPTLSEPAFHADDGDQVADYRSLSAMAIVGLLFGLASVLCFGSKIFLVVPVIGIAISLIALRRIALSEGLLAGRFAAAAGLALCIAFAVAAISRDAVTRHLRIDQAERIGSEWIGLVASGKTEEAFRQTVDAQRPTPPPPEPGMPPATEPPPNPYDDFRKHSLVTALLAAGSDVHVTFDRTLRYDPQTAQQIFVQQQFSVTPAKARAGGQSGPIEVLLTLQRARFRGDVAPRWLVAGYELPAVENAHEHDHDHSHDHAEH